jgi:hypothetical protein
MMNDLGLSIEKPFHRKEGWLIREETSGGP